MPMSDFERAYMRHICLGHAISSNAYTAMKEDGIFASFLPAEKIMKDAEGFYEFVIGHESRKNVFSVFDCENKK